MKLLNRHRAALDVLARFPAGTVIDESHAAGRKLAIAVRELQMDFDLAEHSSDSAKGWRGWRLKQPALAAMDLSGLAAYYSTTEGSGDAPLQAAILAELRRRELREVRTIAALQAVLDADCIPAILYDSVRAALAAYQVDLLR